MAMANPDRMETKSLLSVLRGAIDRHVKQRPRDSFIRNAIDDPAEPLVRRVTENDACSFCNKHANGQPVNPRNASEKFHQFCKCHFMLFFQESRYRDYLVSDSKLESARVTIERGAGPDDWEKRDALILGALGHEVRFLKEIDKPNRRTSDIVLDGVNFEFKNPRGNSRNTIQNQLLNNFYGNDGVTFNPQSDRLLISNANSSMTMLDMENGLARVLSGESRITDGELSYMKEIILLDARTMRTRRYALR